MVGLLDIEPNQADMKLWDMNSSDHAADYPTCDGQQQLWIANHQTKVMMRVDSSDKSLEMLEGIHHGDTEITEKKLEPQMDTDSHRAESENGKIVSSLLFLSVCICGSNFFSVFSVPPW